MATPENWGIFWILVSGVCMSGLAVSIIACIAAAREGAKVLLSPPPAITPAAAAAAAADGPSVATTATRHDQHQPATDGESEGSRDSALGRCGAVEGEATKDRREISLDAGLTDLGCPRLSADAPCAGPAPGAEVGVGGDGFEFGGEGGVPAGWQQQQQQQLQQGSGGGHRLEGEGGVDAQAGAPVVRAGGGIKTGSGEDRTAVKNIFNNFHNLSDLLGLQKGAEDRMTSDELWDLAFAATKKRFEMLTRDLEANRAKLDRQIRDEKRRKPSKAGGAWARTAKGARGLRDGGGTIAAAVAAAAAAAAAADAAQSERVRALNVEGQVLEDLRQSLDDVLREWDTPLSDEEGIGVKSRSPSEDACRIGRKARGSGAAAPPNPFTGSSISPSLETPAAAIGNAGEGAAPVRNGSGAASAGGALSCGSNIDGQYGREARNGGPGLAAGTAAASAHGSRGVHGSGVVEGLLHPTSSGGRGRCEAGSRSNIRNSSAIGIGSGKLGRLSSAPSGSGSGSAAAATSAQDSGRRRRRRSSSSSIESCGDSYTNRNRGASDVTASGPTANHRSVCSASGNRPCNDGGDATHKDAPAPTHRPAIQGTGCFPPPLPRPAGARGVVEEARAFAPAQHLAVLQALLNGEEADGERGFLSDSDSDSDGGEGTGGFERGAAKVESAGTGRVGHGEGGRA